MATKIAKAAGISIALLCIVVFAAGCSTNPVTGEKQFLVISREQEIQMGDQAAPEFEQQFGGKVVNQTLQDYVEMVGQRVAKYSHRQMPYGFTLVSSDVPNAFALPGGKVFITAGLMRRMTNERQLAAVLGHETGHVAAKHNVSGMQRQMGAQLFAEVLGAVIGGGTGEAAKAGAKIAGSIANLKHSRDDEYQADHVGLGYMAEAGYNPWGMVELLTVLYKLNESEPGSLGEMFQTHPLTRKRIERVQDAIQSNDEYRRFSADAKDPNRARFERMRNLLVETVATPA